MKKEEHTSCLMPRLVVPAFCLVVCLGVAVVGCVGYQLGSTLPPGVETLYVPTFMNSCGEPLVETEATRQTIQEFQKDGALRITSREQADAQLDVTIVEYELEPLRYRRDRAKTTREYRLTLVADVVLTRTATGEILSHRQLRGDSAFEPLGDLPSAKIQALPEAARDLAHDIVESVVEYWE